MDEFFLINETMKLTGFVLFLLFLLFKTELIRISN